MLKFASMAASVIAGVLIAHTAMALDKNDLDQIRDKAIKVLDEQGVAKGAAYLGDPANGALDLKGPGLHTWAITRKGVIVFDHSGQTQPGMDVSDLVGNDGLKLHVKVFLAADKPGGSNFPETSWPHPTTNLMIPAAMSCGVLKADKDTAVCSMAWIPY